MSSLHTAVNAHNLQNRHNDRTTTRGSLANLIDTSSIDPDVLQRVSSLTLSRIQTDFPHDTDEESSQAATDFITNLASTPLSPTSESVTSFDFERSSSSDQLSSLSPQPSLYSLTDSLKEQATRLEYGRAVNTHSDLYKLAADEEEAERLDKQHRLYQMVLGDYVPPFREVLEDNSDPLKPKCCLDIGCGSGAWILEVASAFPHVSCTAVDLVPLPAIIPALIERIRIPSNLRFEIDDVNLGLEHFAGDFDVVHVSHISSGIRDYYRLIENTSLALRVGGLADFTENDWRVYDIDKQPIVPSTSEIWGNIEPPEGWIGTGMARSGQSPVRRAPKASVPLQPTSYVAQFVTLARQAAIRRGAHVDAAALLQLWISDHRTYESVTYREAWVPVGNWLDNIGVQKHPSVNSMTKEELDKFRLVGIANGENIIGFLRSARPLLLGTGVPEVLVNSIAENASRQIREARIPLYIRTQNVHARKKEKPRDSSASATP